MPGFVKTPEELAELRERLTAPRFFDGERITVEFLTNEVTYRHLLPPLLNFIDRPLVVAGIGHWESNVVGPYTGGSVSLIAEHDGFVGGAAVSMWMDSEPAISFGRDVLGEPKKMANTRLERDGDNVHAWIERGGVRIVEIHAELGDELGPLRTVRHSFNYRSRPSVDGFHLDGPAVLTRTAFTTTIASRRTATARLTLRSTLHDPIGDIEVVEITGAEFQQQDLVGNTIEVGQVPAGEYLPYHYGRADLMEAL